MGRKRKLDETKLAIDRILIIEQGDSCFAWQYGMDRTGFDRQTMSIEIPTGFTAPREGTLTAMFQGCAPHVSHGHGEVVSIGR